MSKIVRTLPIILSGRTPPVQRFGGAPRLQAARTKRRRALELHVTSDGAFVRKRGDCIQICSGDEKTEWSARKVERMVIGPHVAITSDVIELAIENHIDVVFVRWSGDPLARLWHPGHGSTAAIRRAQLLAAAETVEAVILVKAWAEEKVGNQEAFLRELARRRRRDARRILAAADAIGELRTKIRELDGEMEAVRPVLMGFEGSASRHYFTGLAEVMPSHFRFPGRSRRPARDPFNASLNYAYGMFYSFVERCLLLAGLDPYLGFLHTDRYNKPSLVFDFIEPFRIWADRPVVRLFTQKKVAQEDFTNRAGQIALEKPAKAQVVDAVHRFLAEPEPYRGRKQKRSNILQARAHELAMALLKGEVCSSGPSTTSA